MICKGYVFDCCDFSDLFHKIQTQSQMKQRFLFRRTKSQCRQQSPFGNQLQSHSTHMKFKPFSQQCTMDHIQQTLTSFRNTITHQRCKTSLKDTHSTLPFQTRLKCIINHTKLNRKRRKVKHEDNDDSSEESEPVQERLKVVSNRSKEHNRSRLSELERDFEVKQEKHVEVRHDLSEQSKEMEYAFYSSIHRPQPRASTLLADFNKNNCFLFSRSKRKVLQVQQSHKPKQVCIKGQESKFESFGSYFYGSYMRKYMERRSLLGRRKELINKIAQ